MYITRSSYHASTSVVHFPGTPEVLNNEKLPCARSEDSGTWTSRNRCWRVSRSTRKPTNCSSVISATRHGKRSSPTGKGRSIANVAAHIHHVRLMWLSAADKTAKVPAKLEPGNATRDQVLTALKTSATAIEKLLQKALEDPAGRVPNFRPDVVSFVGYLIAHDAHHRGQIAMMARQVGHPVPPKVTFGLWEWGTLWKECGYGGGPTK